MGSLGHHVTAVEVSSTRVGHARELLRQHPDLDVVLLEGDFYTAEVGTAFDCVTYWNGFGVGTDEQQRQLLRRAASEWLAPAGSMILDVFSPWRWSREAGTTRRVRHTIDLVNAIDFDPVASRFIDRWWPAGDETAVVSQYGRCYSPSDLGLLLEGTGLHVAHLEIDQRELRSDDAAALQEAWEYRVLLTPDA